jgi:ABC-type nickel/cobalt efflux system permease component RcnA
MDLAAWVVQQVLEAHRQIHLELSAALRAASNREAAILSLAGVAFGLGMVHALTPGHGKAILFTYFLGRKARPWAGVATAGQVAGMHVGTAILLVIAFGGASYMFGRPAGAALILQTVSAVGVAAAGCWYLWRATRPARPAAQPAHHSGIAMAAGLLPCPLTMMVLSTAFAHASLGIGLLLVAVMALGIMATIALTGTTAIMIQRGIAAGLEDRPRGYSTILRGLEITSALLILGIGLSSAIGLDLLQ